MCNRVVCGNSAAELRHSLKSGFAEHEATDIMGVLLTKAPDTAQTFVEDMNIPRTLDELY
jgi:hypothetical protein